MYPVITCGEIKIFTFSLTLFIAVLVCVIYYIECKKYCIEIYVKIAQSMVLMMLFAWLGGVFLSAITLTLQNGLSLRSNLGKGFIFYGGFLGAILGLNIYCRYKDEVLLDYLDVYMGILPLGQAIGRIGCYFNGCCYGRNYDGIGAVLYPVDGELVSVFPTWFLESLFCFILFCCFQFVFRTRLRGFYTAIYFMYYSIFRFGIEFLRGDRIRGVWCGISTSQIISLILFLCGCRLLVYIIKNKKINCFLLEKGEEK